MRRDLALEYHPPAFSRESLPYVAGKDQTHASRANRHCVSRCGLTWAEWLRGGCGGRQDLYEPGSPLPREALSAVSQRKEAQGRLSRGHAQRGFRQARIAGSLAGRSQEGEGGRDAAGFEAAA